jgi:glycolate oxidase iron-sulfur subunit
MQTHFTVEQLADPALRESAKALRSCVHCGICLPTCPTYALLGDERDSPRGRIYLIKDMLENDRPATEEVVTHIDRCLSCSACMTACPSGVHYQHLIDHARAHVEATYRRPWHDRILRALLAWLLPFPERFRWALRLAPLARPFRRLLSGRLAAMFSLLPERLPKRQTDECFPATGVRRARVALLAGCVQSVIAPSINAAAIRLLNRHGVTVAMPKQNGCCGAIVHHLGKEEQARHLAIAAMQTWQAMLDGEGLDAILVTASGCGTEIKDYGHIFRDDPVWAEPARRISALARDITEYIAGLDLKWAWVGGNPMVVAYHAPCSLQHGQKIVREPKRLLDAAGFTVRDIPEGHLCCGSAGTYNLLQPEIASRLRDRKLGNIARVAPEIVATGNIGCMTQLSSGTGIPIVHTVELLDWATGGPMPRALTAMDRVRASVDQEAK